MAASKVHYGTWDIVAVPFPYTDRPSEKRRPALVVSQPLLERDHALTWLIMITSASNPGWKSDIAISDHSKAGLPAPSIIRPAKIATVDSSRIVRRLGRLEQKDRARVLAALQTFLVHAV